jgi:hypothetical protein
MDTQYRILSIFKNIFRIRRVTVIVIGENAEQNCALSAVYSVIREADLRVNIKNFGVKWVFAKNSE